MNEKVTCPEVKQGGKGPRSPTNQTDMDKLMDMFGTNRMEVCRKSPDPTNEIWADDYRELESQIGSMTNQMNQLIAKVMILKAKPKTNW